MDYILSALSSADGDFLKRYQMCLQPSSVFSVPQPSCSHNQGRLACIFNLRPIVAALALFALPAPVVAQQLPDAIAAPGEKVVVTLYAQGAQIYECKSADGKLAWAFREPIASLFLDGKSVGRHYAGPNWEHIDGSAVVGKVTGNAPGATPKDIPLLRLAVVSSRGQGVLSGITTIQRIKTSGGVMSGACERAGALHSAAYATDYVFLRK
jgi:hypothetical protein